MIKAIIIYLVTLATLGVAAYVSEQPGIAGAFTMFAIIGGGSLMIACWIEEIN